MKLFRERNPITVGLVGAVVLALAGLATFYSDELPVIGGGTTYTAQFGEAGGIKPDDEVRVAGVKVGKVLAVELGDDHVDVRFRVKDTWVGDRTTAAIRIKTLLGQKNLVLDPMGDAPLRPGTPIPVERTTSPYDVQQVFGDLAVTARRIDSHQLAESLRTMAETFSASTPEDVRTALDGLSALSTTLASRDDELATLLANTREVSGTLARRTGQFEDLLRDGGTLLSELDRRRESIRQLLVGTRSLATELRDLVAENNTQLGPALDKLERVTEVLQRNQDELTAGLERVGPYYRLLGNTVGNGRWIDSYLCGLVPSPAGEGDCLPPRTGGTR
ncbi:phospholipid/cholesterol/gamma-HCH transport system substrate-binding protein [Amycolatopsis arida]|uniref:Phospholipid/cholesterol/gamma-HCH transport system substrate-binding protein n=1 Tax=Amycolatopsis arida TaxID=587909 RepID=A0A1I5QZX3_9PSEU|nr:MCE family protein [Amycolatopsis arida]TDX99022.1 phospholipid/cholesterol/gamma-HCH transport system substrate-binding protein [Amycolatopsis arida]SFP51795.1 phospholipid/cholesterol/gamma-HCH transport system substrate-binding protein [Amycolatopsis arida]